MEYDRATRARSHVELSKARLPPRIEFVQSAVGPLRVFSPVAARGLLSPVAHKKYQTTASMPDGGESATASGGGAPSPPARRQGARPRNESVDSRASDDTTTSRSTVSEFCKWWTLAGPQLLAADEAFKPSPRGDAASLPLLDPGEEEPWPSTPMPEARGAPLVLLPTRSPQVHLGPGEELSEELNPYFTARLLLPQLGVVAGRA